MSQDSPDRRIDTGIQCAAVERPHHKNRERPPGHVGTVPQIRQRGVEGVLHDRSDETLLHNVGRRRAQEMRERNGEDFRRAGRRGLQELRRLRG